ncbi:MAG: MaoC family dehydratase N-terminal domain-containing protein [Desulfobacterales bacterium]|nr:MaoC family dehydratase N-terminal domain-containing protein [Desulfobacterales bacterium]
MYIIEKRISNLTIADIKEKDTYLFEKTINQKDIDSFINTSYDISPLHVDDKFAQKRGFKGRVVHGIYLCTLISKIVGVNFPGENALIQSVNVKFISPVYIGETIRIKTTVEQISHAVATIVLGIIMTNIHDLKIVLKAKVQVGFTNV